MFAVLVGKCNTEVNYRIQSNNSDVQKLKLETLVSESFHGG